VLSAERQKLVFGRLHSGRQYDERLSHPASPGCGDVHDPGMGNRRMAGRDSFHVARVHDLPVRGEAVRNSTDDPDVPLLVDAGRIPGPKPAI
jgi:hypothetical protein